MLLDTHVLLWWIAGDTRLSKRLRTAIAENGPALVSPITFWEIGTLSERGRIAIDRDLNQWVRDVCALDDIEIAPLTPGAAMSAARLTEFHADPADRLIYATARELRVPLASKDRMLRSYARRHGEVRVIWY